MCVSVSWNQITGNQSAASERATARTTRRSSPWRQQFPLASGRGGISQTPGKEEKEQSPAGTEEGFQRARKSRLTVWTRWHYWHLSFYNDIVRSLWKLIRKKFHTWNVSNISNNWTAHIFYIEWFRKRGKDFVFSRRGQIQLWSVSVYMKRTVWSKIVYKQ
jgi:hypothetical protein